MLDDKSLVQHVWHCNKTCKEEPNLCIEVWRMSSWILQIRAVNKPGVWSKTLSKKGLGFDLVQPPLNGKNGDQVVTPATVSWKRGCVINLGVTALS